MKFPYREYLNRESSTGDYRLILCPIINISIEGPEAEAHWDALVDTGADETLLPISLAKTLGVTLDQEYTSQATGVTGEPLTIQYGNVNFRIDFDDKSISWTTIVGFVDFGSSTEGIILGHGGCLDYFTAIFDGENAELELIPNSLFSTVQHQTT